MMLVLKAPAGFDPTWPALPVNPIWHEGRPFTTRRCTIELSDLAALLGPKDCAAPMGLTPEGKHWPASWLGGRCCDGSGKVPQRVALAIETPCATCGNRGYHIDATTWPGPGCLSRCDACTDGVRLRVEYTAQVDAVYPVVAWADCRDDAHVCVGESGALIHHHLTEALYGAETELIIDHLLALADWSPGRVAVLISDVRQLGVGAEPLYAPTTMDVRPFDGPVAELSEVLA